MKVSESITNWNLLTLASKYELYLPSDKLQAEVNQLAKAVEKYTDSQKEE